MEVIFGISLVVNLIFIVKYVCEWWYEKKRCVVVSGENPDAIQKVASFYQALDKKVDEIKKDPSASSLDSRLFQLDLETKLKVIVDYKLWNAMIAAGFIEGKRIGVDETDREGE